ncbi:hypothetical protein [Rhodobacter ferrooxidans]|uniref:Uncharacterized protein n=1 Tax=Rhodobacter ferrooxidans TaxID=371731 RepID=C8S0E8_9RHOB|nr:hypothetical protein [Rhodobacter sp. SW2]EEW25482.1 hypothetical protein Rsw2DRAFT_1526 [Rhodobacter sp. SW2]
MAHPETSTSGSSTRSLVMIYLALLVVVVLIAVAVMILGPAGLAISAVVATGVMMVLILFAVRG